MVNGELHRPNFRRQSTSRRSKSQCASVFTSPKAEVSTKPKWVLVDPGYPSADLNCYVPGPIHRQLEFYRCNCRGGTPWPPVVRDTFISWNGRPRSAALQIVLWDWLDSESHSDSIVLRTSTPD